MKKITGPGELPLGKIREMEDRFTSLKEHL
jgi:hypothetical protein